MNFSIFEVIQSSPQSSFRIFLSPYAHLQSLPTPNQTLSNHYSTFCHYMFAFPEHFINME